MGDISEIEIEGRSVEQFKTFAVRLQHAVLDAVMDHFDEVARAVGTDVGITVFGRQSFKNGLKPVNNLAFAPDHHAVADFEPPDAAAGSDIDEMHALLLQFLRPANGIFVIGIPAVNENVAFFEVGQELLKGLIYGIARRDHQPNRPGRTELFSKVRQRMSARCPLVYRSLNGLGNAIITDDPVTPEHETLRHIGT